MRARRKLDLPTDVDPISVFGDFKPIPGTMPLSRPTPPAPKEAEPARVSYVDRLIDNCHKAKVAIPLREFVMSDPSELAGVKCAIYVIEQIAGDTEETFLQFRRFKQGKTRACARPNAPSRVLYVGSSATSLRNRIAQHMGRGNKATSALHLDHWFKGEYKITVKEYDVPSAVLQIIEDDLSDALKPAFGKQGANNR